MIDPSECLDELRALVDAPYSYENYDRMSELFEELDQWLTAGYIAPAQWQITWVVK
jgi:hypothetical protein